MPNYNETGFKLRDNADPEYFKPPAATGSEPTIVCAWCRREQGECLRDKSHCTRTVDEQRDLRMERQMVAGYERGLAAHCSDYAANHPSPISADKPQLCAICGKRPWIWDLKCEECLDATPDGNAPAGFSLPTPPASQPTVTLSRDDYDRLCDGLSGLARFADYDSDRMTAEELLALLRAAEQK